MKSCLNLGTLTSQLKDTQILLDRKHLIKNFLKIEPNKVKSHLVEKGVEGSRLSTKGFGEDNPKTSNDTRKGRMENRRVEFKVVE